MLHDFLGVHVAQSLGGVLLEKSFKEVLQWFRE
jgi:hypothetical protein